LIFFWLSSFELAVERVKSRVKEGEHFIPEEDVQRRYYRGLNNLIEIYIPICDYWFVIDNTVFKSELISEGIKSNELTVYSEEKWNKIKSRANKKR